MLRCVAAFAIAVIWTAPAASSETVYRLEGQVTGGLALFPPEAPSPSVPYEEYGAPSGGFPVDYVAFLALGPGPDDWSFQFTVFDDAGAEHYVVVGPEAVTTAPELIVNNVVQESGLISIEFRDRPIHSEEFILNLDLMSETGAWLWQRDCPVCDLQYPLPSARAIISTIELVPEPSGATLRCMAAGFGIGLFRQGRRSRAGKAS